ncbi:MULTISPECIES: TniQ family protein [Streptomyces]|uniref:TniQ family protein n=1 Tax=Streptomyces lonegramiae TaxID=3075524 RepID=A0ABU2XG36_9ACTN|nr:TniQ family protein [Streptomyces sp. DSM 41529]MDT0544898.1 TniQ family protein [Streptomyces sp. DSM 41529]
MGERALGPHRRCRTDRPGDPARPTRGRRTARNRSSASSPRRSKRFAPSTRLTTDEAAALTLEPHGERFPSVTESLRVQTQHRFTWTRIDPWALSTFTRYCPKCLAGDGSVIQQRHGGPWNAAEWRLAVSFICRDHRTFLRHLCPICRRPAHKFDAQAGSKLPPLMQFKGFHRHNGQPGIDTAA